MWVFTHIIKKTNTYSEYFFGLIIFFSAALFHLLLSLSTEFLVRSLLFDLKIYIIVVVILLVGLIPFVVMFRSIFKYGPLLLSVLTTRRIFADYLDDKRVVVMTKSIGKSESDFQI